MEKITFNIITPFYLPHIGGIEYYSYYFGRELAKKGVKVNIITSDSEGKGFYNQEKKMNVYRLSSYILFGKRFPLPYSLHQFRDVFRKCFSGNKNITTILQTRFFLTSILGACVAKLAGSRIILIEHGSGHFKYKNRFMTVISKMYEHTATLLLILLKIEYFGVSKTSAEWLKHFNIRAKGIISNGIDTSEIIKNKIRKRERIIFYAGRVVHGKGISQLIDGFQLFYKKNPQYRMVIAGAGIISGDIKEKIKQYKNILLLHNISHTRVFKYLQNSKCLINPTFYPEGLPTVMLEAGMMGTPVITTLSGGIKEVIQHGKTGFVMKRGDTQEIADMLEYTIKHPRKTAAIAKKLQKLVTEKYDWKQIINNFFIYNTIYESKIGDTWRGEYRRDKTSPCFAKKQEAIRRYRNH